MTRIYYIEVLFYDFRNVAQLCERPAHQSPNRKIAAQHS